MSGDTSKSGWVGLVARVLLWVGLSAGTSRCLAEDGAASAGTVVLPASVPDPFEPLNRGLWAVNDGLMRGFVKPTARGYRAVVRKPVRKAINNVGRNLTYPDRVLNNLLQRKWTGARDETYRFLCNSVLGVGGVLDVASKFKIPKSDADFGQTFGQWGWRAHFFLMLPVAGPSNDRDAVGLAADSAANPLRYVSAYPFTPSDPLTYSSPYSYFAAVSSYNELSDSVDGLVRFTQTQLDAYSEIEYAWTFVRESKVANYRIKGAVNPAALETLQSVFFSYKDPEFPQRGKTSLVRLRDTGRRLSVTYWLQPKAAPVVYIVPGLGSHRLADTVLALAELVYDQGYSAVCVSSPFNYEFMDEGATVAVPGYPVADVHDLRAALTQIDGWLRRSHPGRLGQTALLGYSMGAFEAMYAAATEGDEPLLRFDRYVAVDCPVRLLYGIGKLDEFYRAPLAWPAAERTADIENTFLKVATLAKYSLTPQTTLPFDAVESEFLIGVMFRFILRDTIYASQRLDNLGVLRRPLSKWRRKPVYDEIWQYSYADYMQKFLIPYYWMRGMNLDAPGALEKVSDLRTYEKALQGNDRVRVIVNENDFLLAPEDIAWYRATLKAGELKVFPQGGHLGNLGNPAVQAAIVHDLEGLRPLKP
jgi:ABC-type transporter lipoprotein component MlaA/pimeloyl-ACP methyl ester carboxylesterase